MGILSWITFLFLLGISLSYMYFLYRISDKILQVQEKDRQTGDQTPDTPLIITGTLALFAIAMTFVYYIPKDTLGIYGTTIQRVLYIGGIILYCSSFLVMFGIGRSYSRPGFPKKPMTPFQITIGMISAFVPFLLILVLGKFVASGGMTRASLANISSSSTTSIAEFGLIIVLLVIPAISGVFGAGVFGKLSLQN